MKSWRERLLKFTVDTATIIFVGICAAFITSGHKMMIEGPEMYIIDRNQIYSISRLV